MAQISTRTIAQAIYEASHDKEGKDLHAVLENATKVLASRHLLSRAPEIIKHLQEIIDQKEGIVRAHVESAHKLTRGIHEDIEDQLKKRYKAKSIELEHTIDEKHLGGIKIHVGDEVIDLTLSHHLHQLQNHLNAN
jgi:F-type H+-transporting ATPase subunit delta